MTKKNLVKLAGELESVGGQLLKSNTWTRQTVYLTEQFFPIVITNASKFLALKLNEDTGNITKTYKPKAFYITVDGYIVPLLDSHPLPPALRIILKMNPRKHDFSITDSQNLYSTKRKESAKNYKQRIKKIATESLRFQKIRDKIENPPHKVTNNNVLFLKSFNDPDANYYHEQAVSIVNARISKSLKSGRASVK